MDVIERNQICIEDTMSPEELQQKLDEEEAEKEARELEVYKEALRLACHRLILSQNLIFHDVELFDKGTMNFSDAYKTKLEETQREFIEEAEEMVDESEEEDAD